jgi:hypothetical protein
MSKPTNRPLGQEQQEISLLELHPSLFGGAIQCSLTQTFLDGAPRYEALSYT